MFENFNNAGIFVHFALVFYATGFLIRDELWLRIFILCGSGFYLLYYFNFPPEPLWDAIFASAVIALVNISLIFIIIRERTLFSMNSQEAGLFKAFNTLTPGQFRKMMKSGIWKSANTDTVLTNEGKRNDKLFYVVSGNLAANKSGMDFTLDPEKFIGEIAYLLNRPATATVTAPAGTVYIEWKSNDLKRLARKSQSFENALVALFNFDLAKKVTNAIGR